MTHAIRVELTELRILPGGEPIQALARELLDGAAAFEEAVESADAKWQGLGGIYTAPEQDLVLRAFDAPRAQTRQYVDSNRRFRAALDRFGSELTAIHAQRLVLEAEIAAACLRVDDELQEMLRSGEFRHAGEAFDAGEALRAAAEPLQAKAAALFAHFEQAQRDCLRALGGISRCAPDAVATFPSSRLDLSSALRKDMNEAFGNAAGADATPEDIRALYAQLSKLGPELLNELGRHPDAQLFLAGMSPHEEANFWAKLNGPQQAALAAALPALVGNLEGVPYKIRDSANRSVLAAVQRELERELERDWAAGGAGEAAARRQLERLRLSERSMALGALFAALESPGPEQRQLISFDPGTTVPLAAVSVGEGLDTAANVSFLVPGMNTSLKNVPALVGNARTLGQQQSMLGIHGGSTAVVAYMGYETPTEATVAGMGSAEKGAPALAAALDGLHLARSGGEAPSPDVHVVAHSYGTTMATLALDQTQYRVTSAVLLASAGVQPDSARGLNVDLAADGAVDVYATLASRDHLAEVGTAVSRVAAVLTFNPDSARVSPMEDSWGARIFSSEEVSAAGRSFEPVAGHALSSYLAQESFSMYFASLVTAGREDEALALIANGR